jgi:hypothetical protein
VRCYPGAAQRKRSIAARGDLTKFLNYFIRLLVELRGFEPLTSAVQAPARFHSAAASGSAGLTIEGAPLDAALDPRCFTRPAQRQRLEGLAGLDQNRWGLPVAAW